MTTNSELVYSNNIRSAFLTAIVAAFQEHQSGTYLGRTAMQKLTYFVKALGVPAPFSFGIYTYGPYSDTVTFTVESLLADDVIQDRSQNPKYSNYRLGDNSDEILQRFADELRPYEGRINQVVKALGGFSPNELELIATLHFIAKRQAQTLGRVSKSSVVREFKSVKLDKFPDAEIETWFDALNGAELI
jgi:uncharacterized protein YwgA